MSVESQFAMLDISRQLARAEEQEYLVLLVQNNNIITALFYPHIKNFTVEMVVRSINKKYGQHVIAYRDNQDPHKIEIWHKEIALT